MVIRTIRDRLPAWIGGVFLMVALPVFSAEDPGVLSRHLYLGVGVGVEGYSDADHNSFATSRNVFVGWRNDATDRPRAAGDWYLHARLMHSHETESEQTDSQRYRDSKTAFAYLQQPWFRAGFAGRAGWWAGMLHLEYTANSQQLEEREQMAAFGPGLIWRAGEDVLWRGSLGLLLGCNEEEKDDDWPRESLNLPRDDLNRQGCGYLGKWENRLRLPTGTLFGLSLDLYRGVFSYGNQAYRRRRMTLFMEVPLSPERHLLRLLGRTIDRDAEIDFTGFDDRLNQVAIEYLYRF